MPKGKSSLVISFALLAYYVFASGWSFFSKDWTWLYINVFFCLGMSAVIYWEWPKPKKVENQDIEKVD